MPKRSRKLTKPDPNILAYQIVQQATGQPAHKKNPAAVYLGRKGGVKGGPARAAKLSAEERSKIAQVAAYARWKKTMSR